MNYTELKAHCQRISAISKTVVDEFLMYYAVEKERLQPLMEKHLHRYKNTVSEIDPANIRFLQAEFICHRIFRKSGYIHKYLQLPVVKNLGKPAQDFLLQQSMHPWKYTFAFIAAQPAPDFFEMEDGFTGEKFLLYSPGMQASLSDYHPRLWLLLVAFNGQCWQSYGLIIPFKSYTIDDLFFFATEVNPRITSPESLMTEIEENPFPFFMLVANCSVPVGVSHGYELMYCASTDFPESFSAENLKNDFIIKWNKGICQLKCKAMGNFPHFAMAYYHEKKRELFRIALTEHGFEALSQSLIRAGFDLDTISDIAVTPGMLMATRNILRRKIALNPYEIHFDNEGDRADQASLDRLNKFLHLALPYVNANQQPDIHKLALEAGVDPESAAELWSKAKARIDHMRGKV